MCMTGSPIACKTCKTWTHSKHIVGGGEFVNIRAGTKKKKPSIVGSCSDHASFVLIPTGEKKVRYFYAHHTRWLGRKRGDHSRHFFFFSFLATCTTKDDKDGLCDNFAPELGFIVIRHILSLFGTAFRFSYVGDPKI